MFTKETYISRRQSLMQHVGSGVILLLGNRESSINFKHNWYPFRQDSNFLYFIGLNNPGLCALLDCDSGEEIVFGDDPSIDDIIWTGKQPSIQELSEQSGIRTTAPESKLGWYLKSCLKQQRVLHFTPPYREVHVTSISEHSGLTLQEVRNGASVALIKSIVSLRNYKSDEEVQEIEMAANISAEMHMAAMKHAREGIKEHDLLGKINDVALSNGGNIAFPPIITIDGQTLHNHYYGNLLQQNDMVLCDCGAETALGYSGDMTRTFPVGDKFSKRQKEIYDIVLNAHQQAVAALRPGLKFLDIHLLACGVLFDGLKELGLTKGDTQEAIDQGAHTMFFQCGLGHLMGLDVHDMENLGEQYVGYDDGMTKSDQFGLKSLRLGRQLEKGFVLTVEPGLYFIPDLIESWKSENKFSRFINYDQLDHYKDFGGIRIEEDFLIEGDGARLLGQEVPKTTAEIERYRQNT